MGIVLPGPLEIGKEEVWRWLYGLDQRGPWATQGVWSWLQPGQRGPGAYVLAC